MRLRAGTHSTDASQNQSHKEITATTKSLYLLSGPPKIRVGRLIVFFLLSFFFFVSLVSSAQLHFFAGKKSLGSGGKSRVSQVTKDKVVGVFA